MDARRVKRHDYRPSRLASLTGDATGWVTLVRLRLPAAAAGIAFLILALVWRGEQQRIDSLDREIAALQQPAALAAADARRTTHLITMVARDRRIEQRLASAHRTALSSTNTIAIIGNALPTQTWLTNVAAAPSGNWTISGRSTRVTEIGATLRSIQQLDRSRSAQLVSIAATGRSNPILDFVIGWDQRP